MLKELRYPVFGGDFFVVYNLLELVTSFDKSDRESFIVACNVTLQTNLSAYRIVNDRVVEVTAEQEIVEIETAIGTTDGVGGASTHLKAALDLLADRISPDYRNSIKESISAVESVVRTIGGGKSTSDALKKLEAAGVRIHPALREGLSKLYGYSSDGDGIRHALMEESNLTQDDARFMLVACSAFSNYLVTKASAAGVL